MRNVERGIERLVAEQLADAVPVASSLLTRAEDFAITHMRSLALGAAGAVLGLTGILTISDSDQNGPVADPVIVGSISPAPRVPSAPVWQTIRKPTELVSLQAPQFQRQTASYEARSNAAGDREDGLLFDTNQPGMPEAKVILRRSVNTPTLPTLFVDMTRQQAERGVAVTRAGASGRMATKFGDMEVADMTFTDGSGRHQSCLSFRSQGNIAVAGWYCAPENAAVERPEVSCFIDRLSLLKAGEDKDLRKFFSDAEQRPRSCPTSRVSTGRKPTWLDADGKTPAIRNDVTGSIGEKPKR